MIVVNFLLSSVFNRRPYGPGQHGQARKRKLSDFGVQLAAKQKLKKYYGDITEKQFLKIYQEASRKRGDTSQILIELLERRLDAVVFRLKFAPTVFAARQLVSHEHIVVNGSLCNIPSRLIKIGEKVGVREKSKSLNVIEESLSSKESVYEWISWDNNTLEGVYNTLPTRDQIPENIKEQLIVELYSK